MVVKAPSKSGQTHVQEGEGPRQHGISMDINFDEMATCTQTFQVTLISRVGPAFWPANPHEGPHF